MKSADQQRFDVLYQAMQQALRLQGAADKTRDAYLRAVRRTAEFFGRPPDTLDATDLKRYFASLVDSHSWSTVKLDRCGLQFFYKHVLQKQWEWVQIVKPPRVSTLPDVLSRREVERVLGAVHKRAYRAFLFVLYSMGLRLGEGLNLTVGDIDADRRCVHVRCGKGRKDRFVRLPDLTLVILRRFWAAHRNPRWIFPRLSDPLRADGPMDRGGIQVAMKKAVREAGIHRKITVHTLRHCYATHLIEAGVGLRSVQDALGHASPKTTVQYVHLTDVVETEVRDAADHMAQQLGERIFPWISLN